MDDEIKTAFEFARDSTQQLITLATGIIALAITFSSDVVENPSSTAKLLAGLSWGALLLSVFFGLWCLLALTGTLADGGTSIRSRNITIPSILQILTFVGGLVLTVVFGVLAI